MSEDMIVRLTVTQVKDLFFQHCKFTKEYKENKRCFPENWKTCSQCVLRDLTWQLAEDSHIFRDLCFAIWHEDILNGTSA